MIELAKGVLEYLGGAREEMPAPSLRWMQGAFFWGLWWAFLLLVILVFSGQTSKFVYIDF